MDYEVNMENVINSLSKQIIQLSKEKAYYEAIIIEKESELDSLKNKN